MSEFVLRTRDISKKYGNAYDLENVSVEIKRGQIYGLIGLNGAGKTTFMRAVAGLISLTVGEVELFGQTGERALQRARRRIGQSIETPAIYPNMTAEQNLEIQRIIAGVPDKDAVKQTLDVVGLAEEAAKPPVVRADPLALQRVLNNLIQNLLRYAHGTVLLC